MNTSESKFGKDHWSCLAFLETQIIDRNFPIDIRRLRVNETKRPFRNGSPFGWNDSYSTKIKGGHQIFGHDDIDVIDDLEDLGYIKNNGTHINIYPSLTKKGHRILSELREHKCNGGSFSNFEPKTCREIQYEMAEVDEGAPDDDFID